MAEDRTIIVETPSRGGSGWVIAIVLVVALVVGIVFLTRTSESEVVKDNAVASAAQNVVLPTPPFPVTKRKRRVPSSAAVLPAAIG
jgi:flagellar basal body-associated protein FliL